jgi:hypothetical protein
MRSWLHAFHGLRRRDERLPLLKPGMRPLGGNSRKPEPQRNFLTLPALTMQGKCRPVKPDGHDH